MSGKATLEPGRKRLPYIGWRSEELATLALSRIPTWSVTDTAPDGNFDHAVIDVVSGVSFMVEVKGFSSFHSDRKIDLNAANLPWRVPVSLVKAAKTVRCPVVLFLFDVDTDHGRYCRLDNLFVEDVVGKEVWLDLPIANTINADSMKRLARELGGR